MVNSIGVPKMPGAIVMLRMPLRARSRAIGSVMPTMPPLEARVGGLADLAVVGGDARGRDQHAALAGRLGLVLAHRLGGEADHVEAADQVDGDRLGERRPADARRPCRRSWRPGAMPAQLTRPTSLPSASASATAAWPSASWLTSQWTKAPPISRRRASPLSACRSATTTLPPCAREHARRAFAEARGAAGDDEDLACDVHGVSRSLPIQASAASARALISSTLPVPLILR